MLYTEHQSCPTMSQVHDDDRPLRARRNLVDRIQDTVERQQEQQAQLTTLTEIAVQQKTLNEQLFKLFNSSQEQQQEQQEQLAEQKKLNEEFRKLFSNSQEQQQQQHQEQHKQLTRIEETLAKQDKSKYCLPTIVLSFLLSLYCYGIRWCHVAMLMFTKQLKIKHDIFYFI